MSHASYIETDFCTAAPTLCVSTVGDWATPAPTFTGDLESSVPTMLQDLANQGDFDFEDSDTAAEDDTELCFGDSPSGSSSSSEEDSSEGYPAGPLDKTDDYPTSYLDSSRGQPAGSACTSGGPVLPPRQRQHSGVQVVRVWCGRRSS